jgi:hypothetical protein
VAIVRNGVPPKRRFFTRATLPNVPEDGILQIQKEYFLSSIFLFGCETWSLTVREEHKLRVFENRVLRRIFGPKRDRVTGE